MSGSDAERGRQSMEAFSGKDAIGPVSGYDLDGFPYPEDEKRAPRRPQSVTRGRIVDVPMPHHDQEAHPGELVCAPAMVTHVYPDGESLDLTAFPRGRQPLCLEYVGYDPESPAPWGATWHWPGHR